MKTIRNFLSRYFGVGEPPPLVFPNAADLADAAEEISRSWAALGIAYVDMLVTMGENRDRTIEQSVNACMDSARDWDTLAKLLRSGH